jgi:hypothetical protein
MLNFIVIPQLLLSFTQAARRSPPGPRQLPRVAAGTPLIPLSPPVVVV